MMKTKALLLFLTFANPALPGVALRAQEQAPGDAGPDQRVPRYEVPPNARDPFFPPARPESEAPEQIPSRSGINPEAILNAVRVTAIMGAESRGGTAMLNGNIYTVGDEIEIDLPGLDKPVIVKRITVKPAAVVLEMDGQNIMVPLTQAANGE